MNPTLYTLNLESYTLQALSPGADSAPHTMPSFGHTGHMANQSASSGFAPIKPETKPGLQPEPYKTLNPKP